MTPPLSAERTRWASLPGFERVRAGRNILLVRADARDWIEPLLLAAPADWRGYRWRALGAGRGGIGGLRDPAGEKSQDFPGSLSSP